MPPYRQGCAGAPRLYRCVDAAVVRAAAEPSAWVAPPWPDLAGDTDEHVAQWRGWLRAVWASGSISAAVEVASPTLARRIEKVCDGRCSSVREVRRAVVSVVRYVLRAVHRATPAGLFAGVGPARFGFRLEVRHGNEDEQVVAHVDAAWLASVVRRLEACADLRRRLTVVANDLAFVRDGRLVVGCQRVTVDGDSVTTGEVSVRYSAPVEIVVQAAASPIGVGDLSATLTAKFPHSSASLVEGLLAELVARRLLVTNLWPPMTVTDPLGHVVAELTAAGAATVAVPEVAALFHELQAIHRDLVRHDRTPSPTERRRLWAATAHRMATVAPAERPITADLRIDCSLVLPRSVAGEVEEVATALTRMAPDTAGSSVWRDYHERFLERYGPGALVPVTELVDGDVGLGFPAGYRGSRLPAPPAPGLSARDELLLALAQRAAMGNDIEAVLDDNAIAALAGDDAGEPRLRPHTEIRFRLHAATAAALEQSEFELAVLGVSRAAGATSGRFLDLFDPEDRRRMLAAYTGLPTTTDDALAVQVSCPPLDLQAENVARSPVVLSPVVALAEHRGPNAELLPVDDLAVGGDAERLYLVSLSRRCPVEPTVFSAIELAHAAHPLLRFLCEVTTATSVVPVPFSWGAAARSLPFLPRVRYRRTILSPARWSLTASDLPGPAASWPQWVEALAAWRRRFRVPAAVQAGDGDRRIRLDLDEPAHRYLLRSELGRGTHVTLREAPATDAYGWFGGRAHEIVVPLAAACQDKRPVVSRPRWGRPVRPVGRDYGHLPGDSRTGWLSMKLYGHPDRQTTILTTHIPGLLATWDSPPEWWFIRYRDPEPHLRLRIRLPGGDAYGETAQRAGAWVGDLRRRGLVGHVQLDTYYPEAGRFGDGPAMSAAESVFAADSAAAVAQLASAGLARSSNTSHPQAVTAASLADLAASFIGATDKAMRWLIDHAAIPAPGPAEGTRKARQEAIRLANPAGDWAALRSIAGGEDIAAAWARRRTALATYRAALLALGDTALDQVLPDLLHLHHVRMAGLDLDTERACLRIARAVALSWTARRPTTAP